MSEKAVVPRYNAPIDDPYWNVRGRVLKTLVGAKRTGYGHLLTEDENEFWFLDQGCHMFAPWTIVDGILWRYEVFE